MLGIGQITTRVAELVRGALPFAIVNNGTYRDGSVRPISAFARLISYSTLEQALGAGHKKISMHQGMWERSTVLTISQDDVVIEGAGRSTLIDNTGGSGNGVTITGDNVTVKDVWASAGQAGASCWGVQGDYDLLLGCGSDNHLPAITGTYGVVLGGRFAVKGAGASDFHLGGTANIAVGCISGTNTANENTNLGGTGNAFLACVIRAGGSRSLRFANSTNGMFDGIMYDKGGSLATGGSGYQWGNTEEY